MKHQFFINDEEGLSIKGDVEHETATLYYGSEMKVSLSFNDDLNGIVSRTDRNGKVSTTHLQDVFDIPILLTMMQMAGLNISSTTTIGMVEKVSTIYKEST